MNIEVRLFATFREGRQKKQVLNMPEDTSVLNILNVLEINKGEVAILLINGMDGNFDDKLKEGDILSIFPPVGGG